MTTNERQKKADVEAEPESWPDRVASLLASRAVMQLSGTARDSIVCCHG